MKNAEFANYIKNVALPECKKGNTDYFDVAQWIFTLRFEKQLQIDVASAGVELLSDISIKKLIWLSEHFRNQQSDFLYFTYVHDVDWRFDRNTNVNRHKFSHLSDEQYWSMLKMGTFMSNGYYRQQCMEQLKDVDGSLPFLILRMNDWVVQIRENAFALVQHRMHKCGLHELFMALPMLEKVKNARRRTVEHICFAEALAEDMVRQKLQLIPDKVIDEIHDYEIQIRNAIYRFINRNKVLEREQMERLLASEKTGYGKRLLILGIFQQYGYDRSKIEEYLMSKSAIVRYHTLVYRYEHEHNAWTGLEGMLLDSSKRIRDYTSYILEKCTDISVIDFYLEELDKCVSKIILLGIGEHGGKNEVDIVMPYLNDENEHICKAALEAYGKLTEEAGEKVYWRFLTDMRLVIARQAYRCIKKYKVQYGASRLYESYVHRNSVPLAGYFLNLLLREPSWERLPYLLMLYCNQDLAEEQRLMILEGICLRYMYAKVSKQQAKTICDILEQNSDRIPADISRGILFDLSHVMK